MVGVNGNIGVQDPHHFAYTPEAQTFIGGGSGGEGDVIFERFADVNGMISFEKYAVRADVTGLPHQMSWGVMRPNHFYGEFEVEPFTASLIIHCVVNLRRL